MKRRTIILLIIISIVFGGCSNTGSENDSNSQELSIESESDSNNTVLNATYDESEFAKLYPDYYILVEDGNISITNYDSEDMSNIPPYQELVRYGEVGFESEGIIYYVFISEGESYYNAEIDAETKEILYEEDEYFTADGDKEIIVNQLIEMTEYVVEGKK